MPTRSPSPSVHSSKNDEEEEIDQLPAERIGDLSLRQQLKAIQAKIKEQNTARKKKAAEERAEKKQREEEEKQCKLDQEKARRLHLSTVRVKAEPGVASGSGRVCVLTYP